MLDSISLPELEWAFANHRPDAMAGYVGGSWPTWAPLAHLYANYPSLHLLSIAVFASEDADCLDVETGDATIPQVYGWFTRQQARKAWKPCIYTQAGNLSSLLATMNANGFPRSSYRIWSAHYLNQAHICGPGSCGYPQADGTQWTNWAYGRNLDASLLSPGFFPAAPEPPPSPFPQPAYTEDTMVVLDSLTPTGPAAVLPVPAGQKTLLLYADDGWRNTGKPKPQFRVGFHGGAWNGQNVSPTWHNPVKVTIPAGSVEVTVSRVDSGDVPVTVDFA